tara:strand:+ start:414 stop:590 length:177 start_codon:yes stop_codon:yes gene_type:complete
MLKIIFIFFIFSTPAYAYIDPGTGSLIVSFIVGIFTATYFYFKTIWLKLKKFFKKKKN